MNRNSVLNVVVAGFYYIDPNQGSSGDALLAYCNFSDLGAETCLHPRDPQVLLPWVKAHLTLQLGYLTTTPIQWDRQ